jgi:hypothetical protein
MATMQATFVVTNRLHFHDIGYLVLADGSDTQVPAMRCRSSNDYPDTVALNEAMYRSAINEHSIECVIFEDATRSNQALLTCQQIDAKLVGRDPIQMNDGQCLYIFYWSELNPKNAKGTAYEFDLPEQPRKQNAVKQRIGPIDRYDDDPCRMLWDYLMIPPSQDGNPKMNTLFKRMWLSRVHRLTIESDGVRMYFEVEKY